MKVKCDDSGGEWLFEKNRVELLFNIKASTERAFVGEWK